MQEVKAHTQIRFTSALMWVFHGEKHERENERIFWSTWSLMDRTEMYYRDFGLGRADEVPLDECGRFSPSYFEVLLHSIVGLWFTDVCIHRASLQVIALSYWLQSSHGGNGRDSRYWHEVARS